MKNTLNLTVMVALLVLPSSNVFALQASRIVAGSGYTCVMLSDGSARCWGYNAFGMLGNGTADSSSTPVQVQGLPGPLTALASGDGHVCGLLGTGGVVCWGSNTFGQLGDGTNNDSAAPVAVQGVSNAIAIAAGGAHSCALRADHTAVCWGDNFDGQLGDGTKVDSVTPVQVAGGVSNAVELGVGESHTCARLSDGTINCWGYNVDGELGDGTTMSRVTPAPASALSGVLSLSTGNYNNCALLSDHSVSCWGLNDIGELGNGLQTDSNTPSGVVGLSNVAQLATGFAHSCAVSSDGTMHCWGSNSSGELGNGSKGGGVRTPVVAFGVTDPTMVAIGFDHTCALGARGQVQCWGFNGDGELGNGTNNDSVNPVDVSGLPLGVAATVPVPRRVP